MQMIINEQIHLINAPPNVQHWLKERLTIDNPKYTQAVKMGYSTRGIERYITLYDEHDDTLTTPRGIGLELTKWLHRESVQYEKIDERLTLPPVDYGSNVKLRPYQAESVDNLLKYRQGGVCAPCGSGKTIILLEAIARTKQPALWLTHTKELAYQAIERATQVLSLEADEIGLIGDGQYRIGDRLTVALVQSLMNADISELAGRFGTIAVDEAHRLAANSFYTPVNQFPALYRFWASATPTRADGLTDMVTAAGGEIVHTIEQSEVPTIIPKLEIVPTDFRGGTLTSNYTKLITQVTTDGPRNRLIVETIQDALKQGDYALVLSDRLDHIEELKRELKRVMPDKTIEGLHGKLKRAERTEVMEKIQRQEVDILLATQLAREGLDIPYLNKLFLVCPKRASAAIQQEVGRIMRPAPNKQAAVVYDFVDVHNGLLTHQARQRIDTYQRIGIDVRRARRLIL